MSATRSIRSRTYVVLAQMSATARTRSPARSRRCTVLMNDSFPAPKIQELRTMYELRFVRATARSPSSFVRPYSHRPRLVVDRIESLLRSVEDVVAAEVENGARRAREIRRAVDVHRPRERRIALACIDG